MAKRIQQFYFKGDGEEEKKSNRPSPDINSDKYVDGSAFSSYCPISQLGIQALPGTKFYLHGDIYPITIGASGIFDLDIKNGARVTDLRFSRSDMDRISESGSGYLIVDIIYGEED